MKREKSCRSAIRSLPVRARWMSNPPIPDESKRRLHRGGQFLLPVRHGTAKSASQRTGLTAPFFSSFFLDHRKDRSFFTSPAMRQSKPACQTGDAGNPADSSQKVLPAFLVRCQRADQSTPYHNAARQRSCSNEVVFPSGLTSLGCLSIYSPRLSRVVIFSASSLALQSERFSKPYHSTWSSESAPRSSQTMPWA